MGKHCDSCTNRYQYHKMYSGLVGIPGPEGPRGPIGPSGGPQGDPGPPGIDVVSIDWTGPPSQFIISYSSGTTQAIPIPDIGLDTTLTVLVHGSTNTNKLSVAESGGDIIFTVDTSTDTVRPDTNGTVDLGTALTPWNDIFSVNAPTQVSDSREKTDIQNSHVGLNFLEKLTPKTYKLNNSSSGRLHHGFIAQDVEQALTEINKTNDDFAGLIKHPLVNEQGEPTGEYRYGLRYGEFIAPMINAVKQLNQMVVDLTNQVEFLEQEIVTLKGGGGIE